MWTTKFCVTRNVKSLTVIGIQIPFYIFSYYLNPKKSFESYIFFCWKFIFFNKREIPEIKLKLRFIFKH